jgi:hypothetical protein
MEERVALSTMKETTTMPSITGSIGLLRALLRRHRHFKRTADTSRTSLAAQRTAASKYRAVAEAPIPEEIRRRAMSSGRSGTQSVIHVQRVR